MKKIFHKISSFLMALVVLVSTTSFTINEHFCGDELMDLSFFSSAKSCGMEVNETFNLPNCNIDKKGCCTDEYINVQGQDEVQLSFNELTLNQQVFVASFVSFYINSLTEFKEKEITFNKYPPPLIVKNIYKLDEVYLI